MSPNGPCYELIYHDVTVYEDCIGSKFILMHKDVLVIIKGCTGDNGQSL